jgi:hypothetical protein
MIKNINLILTIILILFSDLLGQMPDHSKEIKEQMNKLSIMSGNWEGNSWTINQKGEKKEGTTVENISFKLDSTLLILEGLGKNESGEIVHNAFAIISYNIQENKYLMKAYLSTGSATDADFEVIAPNKSFTWWYKDGRGGTIKFTLEFEENSWHEKGEYSQNGEKWFEFFGMDLNRIKG